jgi:hypothetical protein
MIALNRAVSNATVTPSSARTSVEPLPYTFTASTVAAATPFGEIPARDKSVLAISALPIAITARRRNTQRWRDCDFD